MFNSILIVSSDQNQNKHFLSTYCLPGISSHWEGNDNPLQSSCLENPMDGGAWWAAVHGVAKSRTRLRDFIFTFHFHALEKEMPTHSSVLAWRIPGTGEPGGLPSMGSHRVGHDWSDLTAFPCRDTSLSIHSSVNVYLGCFQFGTITNKYAVNICVQVFGLFL